MAANHDETFRLTQEARDGVTAVVDALHSLKLPHLAGIVYPVCHPEFPACEQDALTRLETLRFMLKTKPHVMAQVDPLMNRAESILRYDVQRKVA